MKKHVIGTMVGIVALACIGMVGIAHASSYEWIKGMSYTLNNPFSSRNATTTWDVRTSGAYYEYRSLYYATSSTPSVWTEWTHCRREGVVDTESMDSCGIENPAVAATTTLYIRSSTQYSGCGTWSPTPNEATCGGTFTVTTTLWP